MYSLASSLDTSKDKNGSAPHFAGYPPVKGSTILEQREYTKQHLDHLRTMLMSEPRGHKDMYGALLVEKTHPKADMAVLFMHNEGKMAVVWA